MQSPRAAAVRSEQRAGTDSFRDVEENWRELMLGRAFREGLGKAAATSAAVTAVALAAERQSDQYAADGELARSVVEAPSLPSTSDLIDPSAAKHDAAVSSTAVVDVERLEATLAQVSSELAMALAEEKGSLAKSQRQGQPTGGKMQKRRSGGSHRDRGSLASKSEEVVHPVVTGLRPSARLRSLSAASQANGRAHKQEQSSAENLPEERSASDSSTPTWLSPEPPLDAAACSMILAPPLDAAACSMILPLDEMCQDMVSSTTTLPGEKVQDHFASLPAATGKVRPPTALGCTSDCSTHLNSEDFTDASTVSVKELSPPAPAPNDVPLPGPLASTFRGWSFAALPGPPTPTAPTQHTVQVSDPVAASMQRPSSVEPLTPYMKIDEPVEGSCGISKQAGVTGEPMSASAPPPSRMPPAQSPSLSLPGLSSPPALPLPPSTSPRGAAGIAFALAEEWTNGISGSSKLTPMSGARMYYPGDGKLKIVVEMTELRGLLAPLITANSAHYDRVIGAVESGSVARAAWQTYRGCDRNSRGYLEWNNGEIQDFVTKVFWPYGLVPPTEDQTCEVFKHFDVSSSGRLSARACLCLVDSILRALFPTSTTTQRTPSLEESPATRCTAMDNLPPAPKIRAVSEAGTLTLPQPTLDEVRHWLPQDVAHWAVSALALPPELGDVLLREEVHGPVLLSLTESDLERLGVHPFGRRRQLLLGIASLQDPEESEQTVLASPSNVTSCSVQATSPPNAATSCSVQTDEVSEKSVSVPSQSISPRSGMAGPSRSGSMLACQSRLVPCVWVSEAATPRGTGTQGARRLPPAWPSAARYQSSTPTPRGYAKSSAVVKDFSVGATAGACAGAVAGAAAVAAVKDGSVRCYVSAARPYAQVRAVSTGRLPAGT